MTAATVAHSTRRKLLWVFLPWFGGMVLLGVAFAALAYAFVIEEGRYTVPKNYLFWGGFACMAAYGWFVLRPRISLLELGEQAEGQGWRGLYYVLAGLGMALSMWLCLDYAASAFGSITPLSRVADGLQARNSQYLELPAYSLDTSEVLAYERLRVGQSRSGRHWDADHYMAMPILDAARDTTDSTCHAWLCRGFQEQFPYAEIGELEPQLARFQRESTARFRDFAKGRLLVFARVTDDAEAWWFESAIEKSRRYKPGPHLLLQGLTDTVPRQNTKAMVQILALWFFAGLTFLGMVMLPDWDAAALQRFLAKRQKKA